jgi:ABC-type branched-subunit amino acid transport system ATPase component
MTLPQPAPSADAPLAVVVENLTLHAGKRAVFEGISLGVPPGTLAVLAGPPGTGRTALALALAGRLAPTGGRLTVLGLALPHHAGMVRRRVGVAGNATVTPLDETLTVRDHVAEAIKLAGPWWRPSASRRQVDRTITAANDLLGALEDAFGQDPAAASLVQARLHRSELIRDASPVARFTLSLLLALIPGPDLLVVDDVDQLRTVGERRAAWAALLTLERSAREGSGPLTVVATCQDACQLHDVLDAGHRVSDLPLRAAVVHVLGAEPPTPAPTPSTPSPDVSPEIR